MPKTRDAFALREYPELFNHKLKWEEIYELDKEEFLNLMDKAEYFYSKGFVLKDDTGDFTDGFFEGQRFLEHCRRRALFISDGINRHLKRLNQLLAFVAIKLAEGDAPEQLKKIPLRGKKLIACYEYADALSFIMFDRFKEEVDLDFKLFKKNTQQQFSKRLLSARKKTNYTGSDLSKFLGITNKSYSQYETGKAEPTLAGLRILSKKLNVSVDWLLGLTDKPTS